MAQFRNKKIRGDLYDLAHLDPFTFSVTHGETERIVRVIFKDHVFTEAYDPTVHTPDLIYSRHPGDCRAFDARRWELSHDLPELFRTLGGHSVYQSTGKNFFFLRGKAGEAPYVVFFEALRSNRQDADVSVIVRSAYEKESMTRRANPVRFPRLIDAAARGTIPSVGPLAQIKRRS